MTSKKRLLTSLTAVPLLIAASLTACSSTPGTKTDGPENTHPTADAQPLAANPKRPVPLTREEAMARSRALGHVTYTLWFRLDPASEEYEGRVTAHFEFRPKAKDTPSSLFLDFDDGTLRFVTLNGAMLTSPQIDKSRYDGHRIYFKTDELRPGANRIEVAFSHAYSKNGNGLHRFKDPVDGKLYHYSNFEPYSANRMFPCFDQPDLKASFELTVEAPESWEVVSNTHERDVSRVDGHRSWAFPPSPVIATYVFALHAGPYASWSSDADGIPLRLFARRSLAQHVDAQEWFDVTRKGLAQYALQFGYPYPYSKYDQILAPDFNIGAMENAAAITFSEKFIFRSKASSDRHRGRANVILHEMAHMWFGDLVTMKWWNGLWLNESFADFMANWSLSRLEAQGLWKGSWQAFFANSKQSAYWEDQLVTTHPIEVPVTDTDQAGANFDGITYGKGASTLKQLAYFLGEENFKEGLQRYFQRFGLKNTTLGDFIKMLSEASNLDLSRWQQLWLQTPGVNTVRADWACEADPETGKKVISRFKLLQSASPASPEVLRPHRTQVALYVAQPKTGKLALKEALPFVYAKAETELAAAIGKPCPSLVFPNHLDYDYVKVSLDPESLKTAAEHLSQLEDPFLRQMLWHSLWEMVVDGGLAANDYAETALRQVPTEKDTQILGRVLRTLVNPGVGRPSVLKILDGEARSRLQSRIEDLFRARLFASPAGSDLQLLWFQNFAAAAQSPASQATLRGLLSGKTKLKGLVFDTERRWEAVQALSRVGAPGASELVAAELKTDPTDMGQKSAIVAESMSPEVAAKSLWFDRILAGPSKNSEFPVAKLREAMRNFHLVGQEAQTRLFVDRYFAALPRAARSEDEEYAKAFADGFFPSLCDSSIAARTSALLAAYPNLPARVVKTLKVLRQEEERCVRARQRAGGESASSAAPAAPGSGPNP